MRRETITKRKIIELTQEVLRGFYGRSIDDHIHYISDDFIWIGAYDFQFTTNKQQFLDAIKSELNSNPFNMTDEYYNIIARDRDTIMLYCKFNLTSSLADGKNLQMHTRLTVIWKYIDNELKLVHIHGSNAQDIPLTIASQIGVSNDSPCDFINYITTSTSKTENASRMFRLVSGGHRILSEADILYLQSNGQNTIIHTKDETIAVKGILRTHQNMVSNMFFRAHKAYLINLSYVTSFYRYKVTLSNKTELAIGKEKYLPLKRLFNGTSKN